MKELSPHLRWEISENPEIPDARGTVLCVTSTVGLIRHKEGSRLITCKSSDPFPVGGYNGFHYLCLGAVAKPKEPF